MSVPGRLGALLFSYAVVLVLAADLGWLWLDGPLGLLMVFVLPGWSAVTLLDPRGRLGRVERATLTLGVSVALAVVVGLTTGILGVEISRASWLFALGGFVVVANTVTLLVAMAITWEAGPAGRPPRAAPDTSRVLWPLLAGVLAFVLAVNAVVLSARESTPSSTGEIVQLWAVPSGEGDGQLDVAVANVASDTTRYRLTVTQGDDVLSDSVVEVPEGSRATVTVRPRSVGVQAQNVEAELRSVVVDDEPLRRVWVDPSAVREPMAGDSEATGSR